MKEAFTGGRLVMTMFAPHRIQLKNASGCAIQRCCSQPSGSTSELECDLVVRESAMGNAIPIRLSMELSDVLQKCH